jgi:hypothetical protein
LDGTIKPEEWVEWRDKLGITVGDIGTVMPIYYGRIDGSIKDKGAYVVTLSHTQLCKYRDMFKKKFGVDIITVDEALEKLSKDKDFKKHASKEEMETLNKVLKKKTLEKKNGKK